MTSNTIPPFHPMQKFKHLKNRYQRALDERNAAIAAISQAQKCAQIAADQLKDLRKEAETLAPELTEFVQCHRVCVQISKG